MRLLHIGSGLRPWRRGGLVVYIEDLMAEQVRRGHDVTYFFSGRQYPLVPGPRLKRRRVGGVTMLEVVNSPLHDHGRQPLLELSEPRIERMFARALEELRPDAVHVQELAGLPFSLLDVSRDAGVPTVVTLQDYFPLCATFKLFDAGHRVCLRRDIGADCVATIAAEARRPGLIVEATVIHELLRLPRPPFVDAGRWHWWMIRLARAAARFDADRRRFPPPAPGHFQRRRDVNVARLSRADRLIAMSRRVAEIYSELGVDGDRLSTVQLTLAHIERLRPRPARSGVPLTFGTLAAFESVAKGAELLLEALGKLSDLAGKFRLLAFGTVDEAFAERARQLPGVELRGIYEPADLDAILDEVDVGLFPSIWEEAYGYAGVEMLAKGIPVIANEIGGIVDWMSDGETGWLNRSCSASELAEVMRRVVEHPQRVVELNGKLRATRNSIVKPFAEHADEIDAIYGEVAASR